MKIFFNEILKSYSSSLETDQLPIKTHLNKSWGKSFLFGTMRIKRWKYEFILLFFRLCAWLNSHETTYALMDDATTHSELISCLMIFDSFINFSSTQQIKSSFDQKKLWSWFWFSFFGLEQSDFSSIAGAKSECWSLTRRSLKLITDRAVHSRAWIQSWSTRECRWLHLRRSNVGHRGIQTRLAWAEVSKETTWKVYPRGIFQLISVIFSLQCIHLTRDPAWIPSSSERIFFHHLSLQGKPNPPWTFIHFSSKLNAKFSTKSHELN